MLTAATSLRWNGGEKNGDGLGEGIELNIRITNFPHHKRIDWNPYPGAQKYTLWRHAGGEKDDWVVIAEITDGNTRWRDFHGEECRQCRYKLRVLDIDEATRKQLDRNTGKGKLQTKEKKVRAMNVPSVKLSTTLDKGIATLSWAPVPGADFYRLQVLRGESTPLPAGMFDEYLVDKISEIVLDVEVEGFTYLFDLPEVNDQTVYYWRVRGENEQEVSDFNPFTLIRTNYRKTGPGDLSPQWSLADLWKEKKRGKRHAITSEDISKVLQASAVSQNDLSQILILFVSGHGAYTGSDPDNERISNENSKTPILMPITQYSSSSLVVLSGCMTTANTSSVWRLSETDGLHLSGLLSPNGDGIDETLRVFTNRFLELTSFRVLNASGQTAYAGRPGVIEGGACLPLWDGQTADGNLEEGIYFYYLTCKTTDNRSKTFTGYLELSGD